MYKEYGPKGLVVVGVTDESKSMVGPDVQKKKMKFPVASGVGAEFMQQYGVRGFPSSFLVDANGFVVWSGHPGAFDEAMLEPLLANVQVAPELPEANQDIAALFESRSYGKAWAALEKALAKSPEDAKLKAAAEGLTKGVESKLAAAKDAVAAGQFGAAQSIYLDLTKAYAGVPGAEAAKPALDALKKDPAAKNELAAADKLAEAVAQFRKGDMEKGAKAFASIAKKFADTPSGARALELAELHPLD